jgi:hypothetical protein
MVVSGQAVQMNRGIARELTELLEGLAVQEAPEIRPKVHRSLSAAVRPLCGGPPRCDVLI